MKVLLEAPILTQSGYGEHSRLVYRALESENIDLCINPLSWGQTSWISSFDEERSKIEKCINNFFEAHQQLKAGIPVEFDMHIHVGIPNEFEKKAPYSICVTAGIETDRVSSNWIIKSIKEIDKIIVPSEHSKKVFESTAYQVVTESDEEDKILQCGCPVAVVPYPVKEIDSKDLDFELETKFNFLSVSLLGHRKNIDNMINWFIDEFKNDDVGLLVKTGGSSGSVMDREYTKNILKQIVSKQSDRKCKIYLLHGDLSESEVHSLYKRSDIHGYITTTHGEGYGLPLFEAAYSGLPIVATNWSGHLDFLTINTMQEKNKKMFAAVDYNLNEIPKKAVWKDILVEGSDWAYPTKQSFQEQMRNVYNNYKEYSEMAGKLRTIVKKEYSKELIYKKMREEIFSQIPKKEENEEVLVL